MNQLHPRNPRADLARFSIFAPMPASLATLIIDLFEVAPNNVECTQFIDRVAYLVASAPNLTRAPASFLHWMLVDPAYGLANLSKRMDIAQAVRDVAAHCIKPLVDGSPLYEKRFTHAVMTAELAQASTWAAFRDDPCLVGRTEWMIASAAGDATRADSSCSLVSAAHAAAVAWSASNGIAGQVSTTFYTAARTRLLEILEAASKTTAPAVPA